MDAGAAAESYTLSRWHPPPAGLTAGRHTGPELATVRGMMSGPVTAMARDAVAGPTHATWRSTVGMPVVRVRGTPNKHSDTPIQWQLRLSQNHATGGAGLAVWGCCAVANLAVDPPPLPQGRAEPGPQLGQETTCPQEEALTF